MERLPQEIFQQIVNNIVDREGLWRSLVLRRVSRAWNAAILRSICIEGILDPLSAYSGSSILQRPSRISYQRQFPHMLQRPPHWHIVPILYTLASSPTRYIINSASLVIRMAADWIEANYKEELPDRDVNIRLLSEIVTIMDKDLWIWNLFNRGGNSTSVGDFENDYEMSCRRSADLVMGLAVYIGNTQLYWSIREHIFAYETMIVATTMAAAYRGDTEILHEMLDITQRTEINFPHLGKKSTGYMHAPHWCGIFDNSITYNVNSIYGGVAVIRLLAAAGHAEALRQTLEHQPLWKHLTFSIQEAMCFTRDPKTVEVLCEALNWMPDDALVKRMAIQRATLVATVFGDTEIVHYMLSQGLSAEEPIIYGVGTVIGGIVGSTGEESLMTTAVRYGRKNIIKLLLDRGVQPASR